MPNLESPEVTVKEYNDLITTFAQEAVPPSRLEGLETDTGLTGYMGTNPLCIDIMISQMPCSAMNGSNITATLFFDDKNEWRGADDFMKNLAEKKLTARLEPAHPHMSVPLRLSITGADMIEKVFDELRSTYEPSEQDGAIIELPLVNPHLLGTAREKVQALVQAQAGMPPRAGGWADVQYGWRP